MDVGVVFVALVGSVTTMESAVGDGLRCRRWSEASLPARECGWWWWPTNADE
jgi:hypothetical protein